MSEVLTFTTPLTQTSVRMDRLIIDFEHQSVTILWLGPCEGCFRVIFILGDKALLRRAKAGFPLVPFVPSTKPKGIRREPASDFSSKGQKTFPW